MSWKNSLVKAFHFIAAIQFFYALYYECAYVLPAEIPLRQFSFGGKLIYLTFLNGIVHACYHTIAFINDFIGSNEPADKNVPLIRKVRDYIFATFAFPVGTQVAFTFWSLYAIDRELVFPEIVDSFYPWWLNQILHTNVALFIIIEFFLDHHQYLGWRKEATVLVAAIVAYIGWVNIVKLATTFWVYPVLNELGDLMRIAFYIGNIASPVIFYFIGSCLNERFWHRRLLINNGEQ